MSVAASLQQYLTPGPERVGFILKDDTLVEVENLCDNPEEGFEVSPEALEKYEELAKATWHTHPDATSNLSVGDYHAFLGFPELRHYIVGTDGVTEYSVEGNNVFASQDHLSREAGETSPQAD